MTTKAEQIRLLLDTTDLSIAQISEKVGCVLNHAYNVRARHTDPECRERDNARHVRRRKNPNIVVRYMTESERKESRRLQNKRYYFQQKAKKNGQI